MTRNRFFLFGAATMALVGAGYCVMGYAMNASFSVAHQDKGYARFGLYWLAGACILIALSVALAFFGLRLKQHQ